MEAPDQQYAQKIIDKNKLGFKLFSTTDRREALKRADYVLALFQVGGIEGYRLDYEIPMKYGVDQCIGQCVGPGGVFRALRSIPVMTDLLRRHGGAVPECRDAQLRQPDGGHLHRDGQDKPGQLRRTLPWGADHP